MWNRLLLALVLLLVSAPLAFAQPVTTVPKNYGNPEQPVSTRCVSADGATFVECGAGAASATATENAPTYVEGEGSSLSLDLAGNLRVTLGTLLACEDQANNLCMVGSPVARQTQLVGTGGVPSTASDATGTATTLPAGVITFHGIVTCTGTCVQVQKIYGSFENSATVAKSVLVATLTMNASTTAVDWVRVGPLPFTYFFVVTSGTSGTTPLAGLFAQYN